MNSFFKTMKSFFLMSLFISTVFTAGCEKKNDFLEKAIPPVVPQKNLPPPAPLAQNVVSGHVIDSTTNNALVDAQVQLLSTSSRVVLAWARTDANGDYIISNLVAGSYALQVSKVGYYNFQSVNPGNIEGGEFRVINASLPQIPNAIRGTVTDSRFHIPISGAQVQILNSNSNALIATVQTDASGNYLAPNIITGSYKVQFSKVGYFDLPTTLPGFISGGSTYTVDATLNPKKIIISGHVANADTNVNLVGATVTALFANGTTAGTTITDSNGNYSFTEFFADNYSMKFVMIGFNDVSNSSPGATVGGNTYIVNANMKPNPITIQGLVKDSRLNSIIGGALVQLYNATTGQLMSSVQSDSQGRYSIQNLLPANYRMTFSKPGYAEYSTNSPGLTVGGNTYRVDVSLNPLKATIVGHVSDLDTNSNLAGAQVRVLSNTGVVVATGATDASGNYKFVDLYSGNYSMIFSQTGYNDNATTAPGDTLGGNTYTVDAALKVKMNTITGHVVNATNASALPATRVQLINSTFGNVVTQTETDNSGNYSINNVPNGIYRMAFSRDHFSEYTTNQPGQISGGNSYRVDAALSPALDPGQYRIVLSWTGPKQGSVKDVDSYLLVPGEKTPLYYLKKSVAGSNLDVDDTDWSGPETVTIVTPKQGTYHYYIANYSDPDMKDALGLSSVIVTVYGAAGLDRQYTLIGGTGLAYEFFTIDNGVIHDVKQYTTALPYCTIANVSCSL